jgi:hypothetical protein
VSGTSEDRDFPGLEGGEGPQAVDDVRAVVNWYTEQITGERRAPLPDDDRIAELTAQRKAAYADLRRLEEAGPQERERLAALYAARLRELES